MINKLIKLANYLDSVGSLGEAEKIDAMIKSLANKNFSKEHKLNENFTKRIDVYTDESGEHATVSFSNYNQDDGSVSGSQHYNDIQDALKAFEGISEKSIEKAEDLNDDFVDSLMERANSEEDNHKKAEIISALICMADELDIKGDFKKAAVIDNFLKEAGPYDVKWQPDNPKSEQSKRYDSKFHHSLQIKEPAKKQERINQKSYDTPSVNTYGPNGMSLQTRNCPDHIGVNLKRIGDGTWQCQLDNAIYNWEVGFKRQDGTEQPGGSVANQTPNSSGYAIPSRIFDSRERVIKPVN